MMGLCSYLKTQKGQEQAAIHIKETMEKWQKIPWWNLTRCIKYCRIAKNTQARPLSRIEFTIVENQEILEEFHNVLKPALLSMPKAHTLPNMAPPSELEQKLQKFIEEITEES